MKFLKWLIYFLIGYIIDLFLFKYFINLIDLKSIAFYCNCNDKGTLTLLSTQTINYIIIFWALIQSFLFSFSFKQRLINIKRSICEIIALSIFILPNIITFIVNICINIINIFTNYILSTRLSNIDLNWNGNSMIVFIILYLIILFSTLKHYYHDPNKTYYCDSWEDYEE